MTDPTATRPPLRQRTVLGLVVSAVLALAMVAFIVVGQLHVANARDDTGAAARQAEQAAVTAVTKALSYDYRHLQQDLDSTTPLLAGDFLTQYRALREPLFQTAPPIKAAIVAEVREAAVLDVAGGTAHVLLYVNQTTTSSKLAQPHVDQSRLDVTMVRSGGRWLLSAVDVP